MAPTSSLPSICTQHLLHSLRWQSKLPHHAWYLVAGVTLSGLNRPDELGPVLQHALEHGPGPERSSTAPSCPRPFEQLSIVRKLREALVRASAIHGLPKAINALLALKRATPAALLDPPRPFPRDTSTPERVSPMGRAADLADAAPGRVLARGQRFFDRTYGKVAGRVMGQMDACGAEDLGLVARVAYGYVLSCPEVLSAKECSFVLLAGLIPLDVGTTLFSQRFTSHISLHIWRSVHCVFIHFLPLSRSFPPLVRSSNLF